MTKELAKTLTTALVQWIDRERPEGTVCCSSYECEKLEKAFEGGCYDVVEKLIKRKLLDMTEFEQEVSDIVEYCKEHGENVAFDYAKRHAKTLLALAKKELLKEWNENMKDEYARGKRDGLTIGYNNGYKDAEKRYNESVTYPLPIMPTPPSGWGCDGTHCTNPHHDCINCPFQYSSGETITTPNTCSGTSTLKAEGK